MFIPGICLQKIKIYKEPWHCTIYGKTLTMSTTSVLFTVGTTWGPITEKHDKERENARPRNLAEIAASELRETPATREQALRIMREWVQKNTDIRNVRQGNHF